MFGRWATAVPEDTAGDALARAVEKHLPEADIETRRIVTAIGGLLGGVAYADRDYSAVEEAHVRAALEGIHVLNAAGIAAILDVLRTDIVLIATVQAPRYCRALCELADAELRLKVLSMLVDLAAIDDHISHDEVALLRNTTTALGLQQSDYNALQARHRNKLGALK